MYITEVRLPLVAVEAVGVARAVLRSYEGAGLFVRDIVKNVILENEVDNENEFQLQDSAFPRLNS